MSYLGIPLAALESPAYRALSDADRTFLFDLYVVFADTERFTVEMDQAELYRQPAGANLNRKVNRLQQSGFLQVVAFIGPTCHRRRVFSFTHPPIEVAEAA